MELKSKLFHGIHAPEAAARVRIPGLLITTHNQAMRLNQKLAHKGEPVQHLARTCFGPHVKESDGTDNDA